MSNHSDGGLAFPNRGYGGDYDGMTLRDYFAGQAIAGIWANSETTGSMRDIAKMAYVSADAMIEARGRKEGA